MSNENAPDGFDPEDFAKFLQELLSGNGNINAERRETQSETTHRTYTYDAAQRLTAMTEENHSEQYAYDAAGNITQQVMNGEVTTYAYDAANRMLTETSGGSLFICTVSRYDGARRTAAVYELPRPHVLLFVFVVHAFR